MAISEKLSIILSCFNEAENIDYIFDRLVGECKNLGIPDLEIIFADDGSMDNSFDIIKNIATENKQVRGISSTVTMKLTNLDQNTAFHLHFVELNPATAGWLPFKST